MKKQLNIITRKMAFISMLAISFVACEDLPVDVQGELVAESFFTSVKDIETATLGVYSPLADKLYSNSEAMNHLWAADDRTAVTGSNKANFLEYDQMQPLNTNSHMEYTWGRLWEIVGAANTFLDNEEKMREFATGGESQVILERSLGEVRFLRALAYYDLVRGWGEIPLITSQIDVTGQEPLASFNDIYDVIIQDLIFAKNSLEPTPVNGAYRATSWMAQSLLANVYLTTAGFPLKKEANYALAAAEAKNVIDNGPFKLVNDYADAPFANAANNFGNGGNTEAIISFPANANLDGWNAGNYQAETIDFGDKTVEFTFYNNFPVGKRKDFTFDDGGAATRPKYSKEKFGNPWEWPHDKDIMYMRYAELLLIYAEAQIRATGSTSDANALIALNEVRVRAGLLPVASATWEDVVWEKAWETAGEWSRWHDIVRTETLDEVNAVRHADDNTLTPLGASLTEANPWALIPFNDVSANPNLIKQ
jgi:hypothetical protein